MNKSLTVTTLIQITCPVCKVSRQHDTCAVNGMSDREVARLALGEEAHEWVKAHDVFLHRACLTELADPPTAPSAPSYIADESCVCDRVECSYCRKRSKSQPVL